MSSKKTKQAKKLGQSTTKKTLSGDSPQSNKNTIRPKLDSYFLGGVLIFLISFILYGSSIKFGYVLDDSMVITRNIYVQQGVNGFGGIFGHDSFMGYFQSKENLYLLQGGRYRPLSLATFAAEISIFGPDKPAISHFINILLYALTGLLLLRLFRKISHGSNQSILFPLLASVVWILHPIHTECVANIKGRDEILALLGSLLALGSTLKYADTTKVVWLFLSGFFLFVGLLAKENALTFIAIIPITIWFFRKVSFPSLIKLSLPLLIAAIAFIFLRYKVLGYMLDHGNAVNNLMNDSFLGMSSANKYATIFYTLGWYIKLLFLPYPLTHDYYPYHVPIKSWSDISVILSVLIYLSMLAWAFYKIKSKSFYAYTIFFFLISISIVSNVVVSVGTFMNERFLYTPSIAFCLACAYFLSVGLPRLIDQNNYRKVIAYVVGAIAICYGAIAIMRVPDWKDQLSLDRAAIKVSKNSARANCFYATSLYTLRYNGLTDAREKARLVDTMEYHINKAIAIYHDYESAWQMKTGITTARYQLNQNIDSLLSDFNQILRKLPNNNPARSYLEKYAAYVFTSFPAKTADFCYDIGYNFFYKEKKDYKSALSFLQLCVNNNSNTKFSTAFTEVNNAVADKDKSR